MIKSFHHFKIKGVNQERFFNNLSKKCHIYDVNRQDKTLCSFKVEWRYAKFIKAEIIKANLTILEERSSGIVFFLLKIFGAYGVLFALIFCSAFYVFQLRFIERIEVWGDFNIEIQQFLEDNLPTKNKNKLNCDEIEKMINDEFNDLSFVSVAVVGQTLVVNVKSSIIPSEMVDEYAPIVSQYDGIVRNIDLIQGTLVVEVGDIIQKGQILVEGYVKNSEGEILNIQPKAEITLDVWAEGESEHYSKMMVTSRTGKVCTNTSVLLFGHEFYSNGVEPEYEQYEQEIKSDFLTKNNILPFTIVTTKYYETETKLVESELDMQRQIELARENCLQNIANYEIIKEENYRVVSEGVKTTIKYVITASIKVVNL